MARQRSWRSGIASGRSVIMRRRRNGCGWAIAHRRRRRGEWGGLYIHECSVLIMVRMDSRPQLICSADLAWLTNWVPQSVNKYSCKPRLTSSMRGTILVLNLDVCSKIDVGNHLQGNAEEKRVSASQCIYKQEWRGKTEEEFGERVHAI